ncbi:MFS general substrate transporter [Mycena sanguinolenta]|uniref:MFS general substrate transporter n=1 Tax=Mycena sanguinolenta TaxID=230812 RepID=A0A8H6ZFJ4_9AGAR|nr:MFS general substrate transporter [Mycena sanguinolenta]
MDTPHVIHTRSKHLSFLLETHPVIQVPTNLNNDPSSSSWAWVGHPASSLADLDAELSVEEERFRRYGGHYPRDPPPRSKSSTPSRQLSTIARATSALLDPEEITWDGPDDQTNPQNWSNRRKWTFTFIVVVMTVNVTFASSAPSEAARFVAADFGISEEVSDLITSMFLLGYVLGVSCFLGSRQRAIWTAPHFCFCHVDVHHSPPRPGTRGKYNYHVNLPIFWWLRRLRSSRQRRRQLFFLCAQNTFLTAFSSGLIADIWGPEKRGTAMSMFTAAVFLGPVAGPIVAGFILESSLGWRWVFWVMMMFAGTCSIIMILTLPETYAPVILLQKAKALRKADPGGNSHIFAAHEKQDWTFGAVLNRTLFRPFKMLASEPILLLITVYLSLIYGVLYGLFQAIPIIFIVKRSFTLSHTGLIFIGVGVGSTIGALLNIYLERDYPKLIQSWRGFPPPEKHLRGAMVGGCAFVVGIFWLGWSGQYSSVPWYVPALSTVVLGLSVCMIFVSCFSYLVETYLMYSASAFAANTFCRSLVAAAFPLFTVQFFTNLGVHWAATLLGGVGLLLLPSPFLFYKYGARIRANSKFAPCLDLKIAQVLAQEKAIQTAKLNNLATDDSSPSGEKAVVAV